jgi:hypothetical protein
MSRMKQHHPDLLASYPSTLTDRRAAISIKTSRASQLATRRATPYSIVTLLAKSTPRVRPTQTKLISADQGATGIVEMLFCTSLVALVGAADTHPNNSPRKLQIVNTKVGQNTSFLTAAAIDNMRADFPYFCPRCQNEPKAIDRCPRVRDLHLRHIHNETVTYH